jgi:hypothetical protein
VASIAPHLGDLAPAPINGFPDGSSASGPLLDFEGVEIQANSIAMFDATRQTSIAL